MLLNFLEDQICILQGSQTATHCLQTLRLCLPGSWESHDLQEGEFIIIHEFFIAAMHAF